MKGLGTDEDSLINVLCRRSNEQRMEIIRRYLLDEIRSETSGNFGRILISLLMPRNEFYARELHDAMAGLGTDDDALIEIMCALSNSDIRDVSLLYKQMFGKTLEQDVKGDTSGDYRCLLTLLLKANRDESEAVDMKAAVVDARALKKAGVDKWGTDEKTFIEIMGLRSFRQIKQIAEEYKTLTGNTLEKDISSEFSGDIKHALLAILSFAEHPVGYFADRLHKSMAGLGTNDKSLVRIAVTRCEIDMLDIREEFQKKHGKTLSSFIEDDTSGDYRSALYALTGEIRSCE